MGSRWWIAGVDRRHHGVFRAVDDQHRRLDRGQRVAQDRQLLRVGAHAAHRLGEALALVGREIVLAGGIREPVPLQGTDRGGHNPRPSILR
jgi:hypothetical protein